MPGLFCLMRRAALAAFTLLVLAFPAAGADCVNYGDYFHWVSAKATSSPAYRLAAAEGRVYICGGTAGLMIYDVSDPHGAILLDTLDTPGGCTDVVVSGDYAFVADGASGLQVVDVSNPSNAGIVKTFAPGTISYLGIEGTRLCAVGSGVFHLIEVTDPLNPVQLGTTAAAGNYDVKVRGNYAYLGGQGGMRIINISDPAHPAWAGIFNVTGWVPGLDVMGNYVLLANAGVGWEMGYNTLVDVSTPSAPVAVWSGYSQMPSEVAVVGTVGFVFGEFDCTLQAWDFSNPASPTLLTVSSSAYTPGFLAVDGGYLYCSGFYTGLQIYDVSPLDLPPVAATLGDLTGWPTLMRATGNRVYAAGPIVLGSWLDIIDATNPLAPVWLGGDYIGYDDAEPTGLDAAGNYVYVGLKDLFDFGQSGLVVVNVSNPASPTVAAFRETTGGGGVAVGGGFTYLAQTDSTVAVFSVQVPSSPVLVTQFPIPGAGAGVALIGNRLHVAAGEAGLVILDVSTPAAPVLLSTTDTPGKAVKVALQGSLAFVADDVSGLQILDVSNPLAPVLLGGHALASASRAVAVTGEFVYVANGDHVAVLNIADPPASFLIGAQGRPGWYEDVVLVGDYIYSCGYGRTLNVLPLQCTASGVGEPSAPATATLQLSPPWPNPSAGSVSLTAQVPAPGRYEAMVFDVSGRIVRRLPPIISQEPGTLRLCWDGLDGSGRPVPDGFYFLKMAGGAGTAVRKIVVLRE